MRNIDSPFYEGNSSYDLAAMNTILVGAVPQEMIPSPKKVTTPVKVEPMISSQFHQRSEGMHVLENEQQHLSEHQLKVMPPLSTKQSPVMLQRVQPSDEPLSSNIIRDTGTHVSLRSRHQPRSEPLAKATFNLRNLLLMTSYHSAKSPFNLSQGFTVKLDSYHLNNPVWSHVFVNSAPQGGPISTETNPVTENAAAFPQIPVCFTCRQQFQNMFSVKTGSDKRRQQEPPEPRQPRQKSQLITQTRFLPSKSEVHYGGINDHTSSNVEAAIGLSDQNKAQNVSNQGKRSGALANPAKSCEVEVCEMQEQGTQFQSRGTQRLNAEMKRIELPVAQLGVIPGGNHLKGVQNNLRSENYRQHSHCVANQQKTSPSLSPSCLYPFATKSSTTIPNQLSTFNDGMLKDLQKSRVTSSSVQSSSPQWTVSNSLVMPTGVLVIGRNQVAEALKSLKTSPETLREKVALLLEQGIVDITEVRELERASRVKLFDYLLQQKPTLLRDSAKETDNNLTSGVLDTPKGSI